MQGSILIPSIFLSKIEAKSSDESKNERGVEAEEKREVQHDHPAERRNISQVTGPRLWSQNLSLDGSGFRALILQYHLVQREPFWS